MRVKIKKTHENAIIPFKTYDNDFCYDVVAVSEEEVAPNVWKYGLGIALHIDRQRGCPYCNVERHIKDGKVQVREDYNISVDFRPRSSVWRTGMVLSNCEGTIDEQFRGEISAVFYNVMTDMPRYKIGDKIGQIKLGFTLPIEFVEVDELDETERGAKGYGSTDAK